MTPYIDGKLTRDAFAYNADRDSFTCPKGHELTLRSITQETAVMRYKARVGDCRVCPGKPICTDAPFRSIIRLVDEEARETERWPIPTRSSQPALGGRRSRCCSPI